MTRFFIDGEGNKLDMDEVGSDGRKVRGAASQQLEVHHPRAVEIEIGVIDHTPTILPDQLPKGAA